MALLQSLSGTIVMQAALQGVCEIGGMGGFILAERGENAGGRGMVGGQAPRAGGV
ncbi:MAG: hypothetical protein PVF97_08125 [Desulfobacterales bacterium]|jgi:hypothetical protein